MQGDMAFVIVLQLLLTEAPFVALTETPLVRIHLGTIRDKLL